MEFGVQLKTLIHRKLRKAIYRAVVYSSVYELFVQKFSFSPGFLSLPEVDWNIQCGKQDILIDLGANIGDITSRLAKTKAKVYAFEPDPVAFGILKRRFSFIENVICINKGVMSTAGQFELYPCNPNQNDRIQASVGSSFLKKKNQTKLSLGIIQCISFNDFIHKLDAPIKFVKMDIEGAEIEVLNSLIDSGAHKMIHKIAVETHDHQILSLKNPTKALKKKILTHELNKKINLGWV